MSAIVAEISLRVMGIGYPALYEPDFHCGSRLRPSTSGNWIEEGGGRVSINSLGFRGPEFELKKRPGVFRLAVLGDSFIEALQVDYDATFCSQLQARLNGAKSGQSQTFEVINCGVSGFGTAQEWLLLKHYVLPLKPDAVLLCVYPENDLWNNWQPLAGVYDRPFITFGAGGDPILDASFRQSEQWMDASTRTESFKRSMLNWSRLAQVLKRAKQRLFHDRTAAMAEGALQEMQSMLRSADYVYKAIGEPNYLAAWDVTERLIGAIDAECRALQIPCLVFTASSPVQAHPSEAARELVARANSLNNLLYPDQRLGEFCRHADIRFFPLASRLQMEATRQSVYFHGFGRSIGLGHWNEVGNAAAARLVYEQLLALRIGL